MIVIYPVELKTPSEIKDEKDAKKVAVINEIKEPLIGVSVGIPAVKGKEPKQYQYKVNLIKYREIVGLYDEPEEIDDTIED